MLLALWVLAGVQIAHANEVAVVRVRVHGKGGGANTQEFLIYDNATEADIASGVEGFCSSQTCDPGDLAMLLAHFWMRKQLLQWRAQNLSRRDFEYRRWVHSDRTTAHERETMINEVRLLHRGKSALRLYLFYRCFNKYKR